MKHVNILGIPFSIINHDYLIKSLSQHVQSAEKSFVITANPEIVMQANEHHEYKNHLLRASYITADGIGIVKASKILKNPLPERVTGYDVMMDMLQLSCDHQYSIYLLGADKETLLSTKNNIEKQFPSIRIAGQHDGYFDWNNNRIAEDIHEKKPDIVFVALGAPKQETWISQHIDQFTKGVFICVGGSFDVISGNVKRAPLSWQNINLEWLYRLLKQPRRWRRMLALPRFSYRIIKQRVKNSL
ncbi:WecB/TagA/CpsF family glycosyltransferase [Halobacillus sp. A1]|uniref:WecB/TagA/CpsF family glycosyltransferase n=1 Tax=Halobacillus sp. A1 TaxID=2880262 RepID=UPI0020A6357F|nr:WecB/TagA/CpsF family glycosyltransferase [Halobacillus sp. A1]MCP3031457.1 WecB/TagA/CpsF family glycosyltransferase [Halobacillus sp. A1]